MTARGPWRRDEVWQIGGQYMLRNRSMIGMSPWRVKYAWSSRFIIRLCVFTSGLDFFSIISVLVNSNSRLIEDCLWQVKFIASSVIYKKWDVTKIWSVPVFNRYLTWAKPVVSLRRMATLSIALATANENYLRANRAVISIFLKPLGESGLWITWWYQAFQESHR